MTDDARAMLHGYAERLGAARVPVLDADTHITDPASSSFADAPDDLEHQDEYYHGKPISAEQLIASMDAASIDMSLVWQNPATTRYSGKPEADSEALRAANVYIRDSAERFPDRLLPAGWTDPKALGPEGACETARHCVHELGFPIVKMNPAQNEFSITDPKVLVVVEYIVSLGAVPAFHFGADTPFTPSAGLLAVARRVDPSPVVAVHMGGGGAGYVEAEPVYRSARRVGLRQRNIHYVLSAKRETHIESDLIAYEAAGDGCRGRISCASDAPYGLQSWNFAGFRALFAQFRNGRHPDVRVRSGAAPFDDGTVADYMGGNFARLYRDACWGVLRKRVPA